MRDKDNPIPLQEPLFRGLRPTDVDGGAVLQAGIEVPRCSFNRSKYAAPTSVLETDRTVIGQLVGADLQPVTRDSGSGFRFVLDDDPEETNTAHMHVLLIRDEDGLEVPSNQLKKAVKSKARAILANAMKVVTL